ncbi:MAG: DinB family protein [Acidimicrobiia bacterium]
MDTRGDGGSTVIDGPLLDRTDPSLARPVATGLGSARSDVVAVCQELAAVPESALANEWAWTGDGSGAEVRYGAYRAAELLEEAEVAASALVAAEDARDDIAARTISMATSARWDLHGLLLPLDDSLFDADPGGGEWSIRLTMGHVISGQRAYGWGTAWWLSNPFVADDPAMPRGVPDELWETLPDEATTEAEGTVADLRARLDSVLDLTAERLAGLTADTLELGARWMGFPITIGFRLGRWSSHIREHSIQIEKTLAMLGSVPGERERLVRHVLSAYGRAEATVFGRKLTPEVDEAANRIAGAAAEARSMMSSAARAAV